MPALVKRPRLEVCAARRERRQGAERPPRAMSNASPATIRRTWRGVLPTARKSASSRWRSCTESANVLATTKIATNAAIRPKTVESGDDVLAAHGVLRGLGVAAARAGEHAPPGPTSAAGAAGDPGGVGSGRVTIPIRSTRSPVPASSAAARSLKKSVGSARRTSRAPGGEADDRERRGPPVVRTRDPVARRSEPRRREPLGEHDLGAGPGRRPRTRAYGVSAADDQPCRRREPLARRPVRRGDRRCRSKERSATAARTPSMPPRVVAQPRAAARLARQSSQTFDLSLAADRRSSPCTTTPRRAAVRPERARRLDSSRMPQLTTRVTASTTAARAPSCRPCGRAAW